MRERDPIKPLPPPPEYSEVPLPPYDDVPLVNQRLPEERAYLNAYEAVGRPRIAVFVNRTLEGDLVPARRQATASPEPRDLRYSRGYDARDYGQPVERLDGNATYLRPGEYEETSARSIDFEAIENLLTDWLAADGRVEVLSPMVAHQRLTEPQVKDLQEGRPQVLDGVARQLDNDILVQVQARPTVQTHSGLQVRLVAEAINVRGGQSVARAVVEVPPPLDKPQLNKYTRFLARRLMNGMSSSWRAMVSDPGRQRELDREAQQRSRERGAAPPDAADGVMRPTSRGAVPTTRPSAPADPREPDDRPPAQPPSDERNK